MHNLVESSSFSPSVSRAEVVRLVLAGNALPSVSETLRWGDVARRAAMSRYGRLNGQAVSGALSGKDREGRPLRGHRHTFYLPTDEDGDGRLDHLTLVTLAGLDALELAAVASIDTLSLGGQGLTVHARVESIGGLADFMEEALMFGVSSRWRSLTPYVLPRHVKLRGPRDARGLRRMVDGPEDQVVQEASTRWPEWPRLIRVERRDVRERIRPMIPGSTEGLPPFGFLRQRNSGSNGGGAFNLLLEWSAPVSGPVAMGFSCHYGLGLFVPAWVS